MSAPRIIECEQGGDTWFRARLGIPTASEFHTVLAKGKDGGASITRRTYLLKLAGEQITGEPMESYSNPYMDRGKAMEDEARNFYSFMTDAEPERVGFIVNGQKGCSPDALIGGDGALEIKTKSAHIMVDLLMKGDFPPEHKAQCQGVLWVAQREWIDLACFWPKFPLFVKRAYRDDAYIRSLEKAVDAFNEELTATVDFIRNYGSPDLGFGRDAGGTALHPLGAG